MAGATVGNMVIFSTRVYSTEEIERVEGRAKAQGLYTSLRDGMMYISREPIFNLEGEYGKESNYSL